MLLDVDAGCHVAGREKAWPAARPRLLRGSPYCARIGARCILGPASTSAAGVLRDDSQELRVIHSRRFVTMQPRFTRPLLSISLIVLGVVALLATAGWVSRWPALTSCAASGRGLAMVLRTDCERWLEGVELVAYIGPDLLLPFTSAIGAAIGVVVMFWHRLGGWLRRLRNFVTRRDR